MKRKNEKIYFAYHIMKIDAICAAYYNMKEEIQMPDEAISKEQTLSITNELLGLLSPHYCIQEITPDTEAQARKALSDVATSIKEVPVYNPKGAGSAFTQSGSYFWHLEFIYFALLHHNYSDACNETSKYLHCHFITERRHRDALLALFKKFNIA